MKMASTVNDALNFSEFSRITHILILCFFQVYYTKTLAPEAELNIASFIKEQKYGVLFENQQIRNMHR